jgi:hypothetical protein
MKTQDLIIGARCVKLESIEFEISSFRSLLTQVATFFAKAIRSARSQAKRTTANKSLRSRPLTQNLTSAGSHKPVCDQN